MDEPERRSLALCCCSNWYPAFRDVSLQATFVPLNSLEVQYLVSDGIDASEVPDALPSIRQAHDGASQESAILSGLKAKISSAIAKMGGAVAPKLNWSAPIDAQWLSPGGLRCTNADEVILLLKASDRAASDITHLQALSRAAIQGAVQPELVLKRWDARVRSEREFRCFVLSSHLVGACQRDPTRHHPELTDQRADLCKALSEFFGNHIQRRCPLQNCAYDVYVSPACDTVTLVDINPAGGAAHGLLFSWAELQVRAERGAALELRLVEDSRHVQAGPAAAYGAPLEAVAPGDVWTALMGKLQRATREGAEYVGGPEERE